MPTLPQQIGGAPTRALSVWANHLASGTAALVGTWAGKLLVFPLSPVDGVFPGAMTANTMLVGVSGNAMLLPSVSSLALSAHVGLYTLANSTRLSLLNRASTSYSGTPGATDFSGLVHGPRQISFHSSQWSAVPSFSQTQYWVGLQFNSAGAGVLMSISGFQWMETRFSGHIGVGNTNSTASRPFPGMGVYSTTFTTGLPGSIAFSQLRQADALAGAIPTIVINNIGA